MTMKRETTVERGTGAMSRFMTWWLDGLAAVVDGETGQSAPWTRLMVKTADGVSVHTRRRNALKFVKTFPNETLQGSTKRWRLPPSARARRGDVSVLRLGTDQVLTHELNVPKAAEDVIDPVIRNQLERLVPWPTDDLIYGYEIQDRKVQDDHLRVTCVATSMKRIAAAQGDAERLDFRPDTIDVAGDAEAPVGIPLRGIPMERERHNTHAVGRTLAAIALLAGLAGATGFGRMAMQDTELAALQAKMAQVDTHVAEAHRLEEANAAVLAERTRLVSQRAVEPAMVSTLEALSRALPDHAHLERLEVRAREVELRGRARDAASLMKGLEASPAFSDAKFSAPTTRASGGETFAITLQLTPAGQPGEPR